MSLILHSHPLASYCWKVLIALYEKDIPFETRMVNLGDPAARAAFEALWPTAKIPLLEDDGRVVPETSIMIEYIDQIRPGPSRLLPGTPQEQLEVRLWDRVFDSYVMEPMQRFVAQHLRPEGARDARELDNTRRALVSAYALIEAKIGERTWAAGETFTLADCAAAPSLFYAATIEPFAAGQTRLAAYFARLMARPSVARTIAEARPFFQYYPLRHALPTQYRPEDDNAG
ncbi:MULTISPECIES: glutathione S-transferase family protein [Asticcacaulis]|uniref:glutathione S-transferase family protein n=1 Tax=Asticcacaulis TaxID=76890 RepID=UPI001AE37CFA|nr:MULTISPECIES: glutathione S-transferase family protein [Asticcacaulis]MBP2159594.1 glutathione S-transferase [Asticcacaulis solisilvae]MDR6800579.1 glutathione S-transferase [Asticcacaulis sp. BE141]